MNRIASSILRVLLVDRTGQTLLIAALLLSLGGLSVNVPLSLGHPIAFWYEKLGWRGNANVVLLGDSRIHCDLSPRMMMQELQGMKILNFGFSSLGYSDAYFDAAERIWDDKGGPKIAVLGITPHSLTDAAARNNFFVRMSPKYGPIAHLKVRTFGWMEARWPSIAAHAQFILWMPRRKYALSMTRRHSDGWTEILSAPTDPPNEIATYRRCMQQSPVSREITNLVLQRTRTWTERGIVVYAFRPPTCDAMEEVENRLGRFDERSFARAFEEAGGRWLLPSDEDLQALDGSHLDGRSALMLSTRVARSISLSQQMISEQTGLKSDSKRLY